MFEHGEVNLPGIGGGVFSWLDKEKEKLTRTRRSVHPSVMGEEKASPGPYL